MGEDSLGRYLEHISERRPVDARRGSRRDRPPSQEERAQLRPPPQDGDPATPKRRRHNIQETIVVGGYLIALIERPKKTAVGAVDVCEGRVFGDLAGPFAEDDPRLSLSAEVDLINFGRITESEARIILGRFGLEPLEFDD